MNKAADIATWSLLVGAILVLTRPGSQGPKFVTAVGGAWAHVVQASTGQRVAG